MLALTPRSVYVRLVRRLALLCAVALLAAGMTVDVASAKGGLGMKKARSVTLKLAQRVAIEEGATHAYAGGCKRRNRRTVVCWGAIVKGDYGAAQKVRVKKRRGKIRAKRFGRVVEGRIRGSGGGGGGGGEWAVCSPSGYCVGS